MVNFLRGCFVVNVKNFDIILYREKKGNGF